MGDNDDCHSEDIPHPTKDSATSDGSFVQGTGGSSNRSLACLLQSHGNATLVVVRPTFHWVYDSSGPLNSLTSNSLPTGGRSYTEDRGSSTFKAVR